MRSLKPASFASAIVVILGALVPFSGCGLSTVGTGEFIGGPCEKDSDCVDLSACTSSVCGPVKRCVTTVVPDVVPDDANACTTDHCAGATAAHDPLGDGTPCTEGLGSGTCQAAKCNIVCNQLDAMMVCNDNQRCTIDTCDPVMGSCSRTKLDNLETPGMVPLPGDCKQRRCVDGVDTELPDDTDLPTDLACYDEACVGGVLSMGPSPVNTMCGEALICDGNGACVGCTANSQCPSTFCAPGVCQSNGTCGTAPALPLTPLPPAQQDPVDCLTFVCDGMGGIGQIANDGEMPPPDNIECTDDICMSGTIQKPPLTGATCTMGGVICNNGVCAQCAMPSNCPDADPNDCIMPTCSPAGVCGTAPRNLNDPCTSGGGIKCNATGMCVACNVATDCPDPGPCKARFCAVDGTCMPTSLPDNDPCTNGMCKGGLCKLSVGQPCAGPGDCFGGNCPTKDNVCCDMPCAGLCYACRMAATGVANGTCAPVTAGTDLDDDCSTPGSLNCNGSGVCGP